FQVANTKNLSIKSGMFGKVNLSESEQEQGILIPAPAIIEENGIAKVYVVKNGKATLQSITTTKTIGNKTLVSSGLKENDIIVTNGFINLFDGANVLIN
ncbi:MAG: efflux RND transporter periplasmic adaptor subunit, partial [Crocinitomicaceae bacterium]|nr:efflux RND transporter periplasmic adaptor subunit [Crocinitomicaceae bacterium]